MSGNRYEDKNPTKNTLAYLNSSTSQSIDFVVQYYTLEKKLQRVKQNNENNLNDVIANINKEILVLNTQIDNNSRAIDNRLIQLFQTFNTSEYATNIEDLFLKGNLILQARLSMLTKKIVIRRDEAGLGLTLDSKIFDHEINNTIASLANSIWIQNNIEQYQKSILDRLISTLKQNDFELDTGSYNSIKNNLQITILTLLGQFCDEKYNRNFTYEDAPYTEENIDNLVELMGLELNPQLDVQIDGIISITLRKLKSWLFFITGQVDLKVEMEKVILEMQKNQFRGSII